MLVVENCARIKGAGKLKRTKKKLKMGKLRKRYSNTNRVRYQLNSQFRKKGLYVYAVCSAHERCTK